MQPNSIYYLTIHPEWFLHYYLCANISYISHMQLYIAQLSSTETGDKKFTYQHLAIFFLFFFFTYSSFYCLFILDNISFQSSQPSVAVCIFRELYSHLERFYFLLCLSFALFRFLSTSMVTAAIILSILVWFESCTIQCGLQSRLQSTTNL